MKLVHRLTRMRFNVAEVLGIIVLSSCLQTSSFVAAALWLIGMIIFCPKAKDVTA